DGVSGVGDGEGDVVGCEVKCSRERERTGSNGGLAEGEVVVYGDCAVDGPGGGGIGSERGGVDGADGGARGGKGGVAADADGPAGDGSAAGVEVGAGDIEDASTGDESEPAGSGAAVADDRGNGVGGIAEGDLARRLRKTHSPGQSQDAGAAAA